MFEYAGRYDKMVIIDLLKRRAFMRTVRERLDSKDWKEFRTLVPTAVYEQLEAEAIENMRTPGNHNAWILDERFNNKKRSKS